MEFIKQIQARELGALEELRRICLKYDLRYFLAQGTLIDAARENGFIPWDDDIDVIMPYTDLQKLICMFPFEGNGKYKITNHKIEKHYPLSWTKIRIENTLSRPVRYKDIPVDWGICIDIFPIYPLSNTPVLRRAEIAFFKLARKMLLAEMTRYDGKRSALVKLFEKIPIPVRHMFMDAAVWVFARHKDNTDFVYVVCK